jgi:hypothetical protein
MKSRTYQAKGSSEPYTHFTMTLLMIPYLTLCAVPCSHHQATDSALIKGWHYIIIRRVNVKALTVHLGEVICPFPFLGSVGSSPWSSFPLMHLIVRCDGETTMERRI